MVDQRNTNAECIAKMHRRHCSEGVDEIAFHEDGLAFVVADGVEEAVFLWKKTRRHARIDDED